MTVNEMARIRGLARAMDQSRKQIREEGRRGGQPHELRAKELNRLQKWFATGKTQRRCTNARGVSVRTVGLALLGLRNAARWVAH